MKKTPLVCVILLVAGLGFADQLEMTHRKIHIDSQNPSRTDTYINRSSDNTQLTDPIVATAALNNWREKTTSTLVVDKNGRGDYTTIQAAINSIDDSASTNPYVVYVMPGVYEEQVKLDEDYVSVIGLGGGSKLGSAYDVVLVQKDVNGGNGVFWVTGSECLVQNLKIDNTHATVANATLAIKINTGAKVTVESCSLLGNGRDTVYVFQSSTLAEFWNCYIEGGSDVVSIENEAKFFNCWVYVNRTGQEALYINSGLTLSALWIVGCFFDGAGTNHIGNFNSDDDILHFHGNYISEAYTTYASTNHFEYRGYTPTVYFSTHAGDFDATGDATFKGGLNVGTATGAAAGEIKTSGNISASDQRITAKLFDVEHYTGGLPTASSTYRGCLAFVEAGTGSNDKLYVCVKNADGSYAWDEIGHGISE